MWKDTVINLKVYLLQQMLLAELKHLTPNAALHAYQEYNALTSEKNNTEKGGSGLHWEGWW